MLTYNTGLQQLVLPEYGRNIQRMVDHCLSIKDRDERTACAHSIIRSMGNLFPELRAPENEHKLWDHLMIMARFNLDIDFPCEVIQAADLPHFRKRCHIRRRRSVTGIMARSYIR